MQNELNGYTALTWYQGELTLVWLSCKQIQRSKEEPGWTYTHMKVILISHKQSLSLQTRVECSSEAFWVEFFPLHHQCWLPKSIFLVVCFMGLASLYISSGTVNVIATLVICWCYISLRQGQLPVWRYFGLSQQCFMPIQSTSAAPW